MKKKSENRNKQNNELINSKQISYAQEFCEDVANIIENARKHVARTADLTMCMTNFIIGGLIIEQEQDGKNRAKYGRGVIAELSAYLNSRFGRGFSETNLRNYRKFYQIYSKQIQQNISVEFKTVDFSIGQNNSDQLKDS